MNKKKILIPAIIIIMLLTVIGIPGFLKARQTSRYNACLNNLLQIASGIESWALATHQKLGTPVNIPEISLYIFSGTLPSCPTAGKYDIPPVGKRPECSIHGDLLNEIGWDWPKWPQEMRSNNTAQGTARKLTDLGR